MGANGSSASSLRAVLQSWVRGLPEARGNRIQLGLRSTGDEDRDGLSTSLTSLSQLCAHLDRNPGGEPVVGLVQGSDSALLVARGRRRDVSDPDDIRVATPLRPTRTGYDRCG